MSIDQIQVASLWGQAYEVAVKRGVIAYLLHEKIVSEVHGSLVDWRESSLRRLFGAMRDELDVVDEIVIDQVNHALSHLLVLGYGQGWTIIREYLSRLKGRQELAGLWCPLTLPSKSRDRAAEAEEAAARFLAEFAGCDVDDSLTRKGEPAWSDFTLWLHSARKNTSHMLVLEFSYNAPLDLPDFTRGEAHLDELMRYGRMIDSRGVFSRVCAEVKGERFDLSPLISHHLTAFSGTDKPFYKLCQGSSYLEKTIKLLTKAGKITGQCMGRAIAVTPNGMESVAGIYGKDVDDAGQRLIHEMAHAYRNSVKVIDEEAEARLTDEIRMAFNQIQRNLPSVFRKQLRQLQVPPEPGECLEYEFSEAVEQYYRPTDRFSLDQAYALLGYDDRVRDYLGQDPREATGDYLTSAQKDSTVSLRDLHSSAVVAGMRTARKGRLNVLALEGNPGIGKTTAVRSYLSSPGADGYLFLYVSPRVVINKDVTDKFAKNRDGSASGIMTLTTNSTLIRNASVGHEELVINAGGLRRVVDSAVVVEGVDDALLPEVGINTWFITPEQEHLIENLYGGQRFKKETVGERRDVIRERQVPGVLRILALGALRMTEANPQVNRMVLTAAIQGYRETEGGTTINGLSRLFESPRANSRSGRAERERFAQRFPNIVVMLDEVAGDGAGALFVEEIASWLQMQFIEPFEESPFKVSLIIADASLGNEYVLESYLGAKPVAPEKVLVSKSGGSAPFRLAATSMVLGGEKTDVLHVMTNSYPATTLGIDYRVKLHKVHPEMRDDGSSKSLRERIASQAGDLLLESAEQEVLRAISAGHQQVIYFAQNKDFLSHLRTRLVADNGGGPELQPEEVAILDSSVRPSERKALIEENRRDSIRVFLMTSSGARGVSFPKATSIIASIPRFNLESSLMEVAQLIYRGRGNFSDPLTGKTVSGDDLPRNLVMLIDDFAPEEDLLSDPRLWLRRASDILTLVVMLRATIHTRIKGDAGLPGKDLAIVPVGLIGSSELLTTMSQVLETFLKEGNVCVQRTTDRDTIGLISNAIRNVLELFGTYDLFGDDKEGVHRSFTGWRDLDEFVVRIARSGGPLLINPDEKLSIPDTTFCPGPFWAEDWSALQKRESFVFDKYAEAIDEAERKLKGQLVAIYKEQSLPPKLRDAARDLYRIVAREQEDTKLEFETLKAMSSRATWLALPIDFPRFWKAASPEDGKRTQITHAPEWRNALARTLMPASNVVPVVANYHDFPFAASIGTPDPLRLYQIFDDRYFMASGEFNLLNTILLANEKLE
jgi:hypothetical protein